MKKAELVNLCKTLGLPLTGTKPELQNRICDAVRARKAPRSKKQPATLIGLYRSKDASKLAKLASDMKEMFEEDAEMDSIRRAVRRIHGVTVKRDEYESFIEIIDAANKKDYEYIEENIEQWRASGRGGVIAAEAFARSHKDQRLIESLNFE